MNIDDALSIGLIKKSNKTKDEFYDFFRNRFMFPIKDYKSNIIAFGGRALDNSNIKYICMWIHGYENVGVYMSSCIYTCIYINICKHT